jgi:hypothetical protein
VKRNKKRKMKEIGERDEGNQISKMVNRKIEI